ncbi:ORF1 [torque teno Delphinidae virus 40]
MPYGAYRRRGSYNRRYRRYKPYYYRRRWRARRHRYWSWRHRRPLYRWVRGLRYKFSRSRRLLLRRKRRRAFIRWNRKYRYKMPKPVRLYNPPYVATCYIKGYFPLLYFTGKQISWPFIDPITHRYHGGGLAFNDFSLNMLYLEHEKLRNTWTRSNYGFQFARFLKGRFTLYRHPYVSYMAKFFQGSAIHKNQTYMDIHPGYIYLHRKKVIMAANNRVPDRKKFKKKKIRFRAPKDLTKQWYDMNELGQHILIRLGVTIADFLNPFENATDGSGNYYYTIGYHTPDRRTLEKYTWTYSPLNDKYSVQDINQWGPDWITWGGPINIKLPYGKTVNWCDNKYPELVASAVTVKAPKGQTETSAWFQDNLICGTELCSKKRQTIPSMSDETNAASYLFQKDPNYFDWGDEIVRKRRMPAYYLSTSTRTKVKKTMAELCQIRHQITEDLSYLDSLRNQTIEFEQLVAGLPATNIFQELKWSFSSHRTSFLTDYNTLSMFNKAGKDTQGFWPGRYNANYDTGVNNVVYGLYIPISMGIHSSFKKMQYGETGPGWGAEMHFEVEEFFPGVPYWLLFYGHTYSTFLDYLNILKPEFKSPTKSLEGAGFFAIAIRAFPAEPVMSGPFYAGYAPLRYLGWNKEYFCFGHGPPGPKPYWKWNTNKPPVDHCGNIDENAKIFCILRDGRNVNYGSSLEGSLLNSEATKPYFCTTKQFGTVDDVALIGRSGPFVMNAMDPSISSGVTNIFGRYMFKFQWAGFTPPDRKRPQDTRDPCTKYDTDEEQPAPPRYSRSRRALADDPDYPQHPTQVYYNALIPQRDLTPSTGRIRRAALERLTSTFPDSAEGRGLQKTSSTTGNRLFLACSDLPRGSCSSPSETEEAETGPRETIEDLWPALAPYSAQLQGPPQVPTDIPAPVPGSRRRKRSTQDQQEGCLPCRSRWEPQPHRRRTDIEQRVRVLRRRVRHLRRLSGSLEHVHHCAECPW